MAEPTREQVERVADRLGPWADALDRKDAISLLRALLERAEIAEAESWSSREVWAGENATLGERLRAAERERDEAREIAADWRNEARGSLTLSHPSRAAKERLPWEAP